MLGRFNGRDAGCGGGEHLGALGTPPHESTSGPLITWTRNALQDLLLARAWLGGQRAKGALLGRSRQKVGIKTRSVRGTAEGGKEGRGATRTMREG
jgi:hypothetical protein